LGKKTHTHTHTQIPILKSSSNIFFKKNLSLQKALKNQMKIPSPKSKSGVSPLGNPAPTKPKN
jgi:hypothetical protein